MATLNAWLDSLPRTSIGARGRETPAFRSIGVAGFYLALLVTLGTGLATGQSPVVLSVVAVACAASFFGWALLRRAVTGRESLVLLEHVWVALACAAAVIAGFGEPVLAQLDSVALGLCAFLAVGRLGCLVVGCCYGQPALVGITYGPAPVADGFPPGLVGVRLFPVQLVEAAGIALIGLVGAVALPFVPPGRVFVWFLLAYAVLRFGMEGLRGDPRPSVLGLSVPRWMSIAQAGFALLLAEPGRVLGPGGASLGLVLVAVLAVAFVWRRRDPDRALRDPELPAEARKFVEEVARSGELHGADGPVSRSFAGGLSAAVSASSADDGPALHVSFALAPGRRDLRLLSDLTAAIVPEALPGRTSVSGMGVLHVLAPLPLRPWSPDFSRSAGLELYGDAVRRLQAQDAGSALEPAPAIDPIVLGRQSYFGARFSTDDRVPGQPGGVVGDGRAPTATAG
jgi:hypothetical protein